MVRLSMYSHCILNNKCILGGIVNDIAPGSLYSSRYADDCLQTDIILCVIGAIGISNAFLVKNKTLESRIEKSRKLTSHN